jgi:hypothetical protein
MRIVIAALTIFAFSTAANAATTSYACNFSVEATPKGLSAQKLELRYVVDDGTKRAYLIGNAGSSEVKEIPNASGVSFVEITDSGNIMITAISESGDSVHSRNGIMFGQLVPSQYYGKCVKQ